MSLASQARICVPMRRFNAKFGGARPSSGSLGASHIFYLDYSDDPWAAASVQSAQPAHDLQFCLTSCDGCGHCGAGVPDNLTRCSDASDAFVAKLLSSAQATLRR